MLVLILCILMEIQVADRMVSLIREKKCRVSTLIISVPTLIYALCFGIYSIITKSSNIYGIAVLCICSVLSSLWCINYVSKKHFLDYLENIYYFFIVAFTVVLGVNCIFPSVVENDMVLINSTTSNMKVIDTENNIYAYVSPYGSNIIEIKYKTDEDVYKIISAYKDDIKVVINAGIQPSITKEQYEIIYENIFGVRKKEEDFSHNKYLITVNDYSEILKSELLTGKTN